MKILNETQQAELKPIWDDLREFQDLQKAPTCDPDLKSMLREYTDERTGRLPRRLRQFDSDIVAIVTMGMLKAGKSTLVNLLARTTKASPVGYGVDTTLRPALIKMAKKGDDIGPGRIYIYNSIDDGKETRELFGAIMDYLRGLDNTISRELDFKWVELTHENLSKALCRKAGFGEGNLLEQEPLLVVVEVPYNNNCQMLKDKRMLLDMPGLDSAHAAITQSASEAAGEDSYIGKLYSRYEAVISECDLMLFVQSSVAPLNDKAATMLRKILLKRPSASCYIVQNAMRARYWRTEDNQRREQERQGEHAMGIIEKMLRRIIAENSSGHYLSPKTRAVNLGMAYDGEFTSNDELASDRSLTDNTPISAEALKARSEFFDLENSLLDTLKDNGVRSRFIHCRGELSDVIKEANDHVAKAITEEKGKLEREAAELGRWKNNKNKLLDTLAKGARFSMPGDIRVDGLPDFTRSERRARSKFEDMSQKAKISVDVANDYLHELKQACYDEAARFIANEATIANLRLAVDEDDMTMDISGIHFCNDCIAKAFGNIEHNVELATHAPSWHLSKESNPLNMDINALGGFGDFNGEIERISPMEKERNWIGFGKKISPENDPILKDKEKMYKEAFTRMTESFIRRHIEAVLRRIVSKGVEDGAKNYIAAHDEKIDSHSDECERLKLGIARRQRLNEKLGEFLTIVENLNI